MWGMLSFPCYTVHILNKSCYLIFLKLPDWSQKFLSAVNFPSKVFQRTIRQLCEGSHQHQGGWDEHSWRAALGWDRRASSLQTETRAGEHSSSWIRAALRKVDFNVTSVTTPICMMGKKIKYTKLIQYLDNTVHIHHIWYEPEKRNAR